MNPMTKAIYFDMDGTIADLYAVDNWLPKLRAEDASPYAEAKPLVNLQALAHRLNALQKKGYHIGIISWLSKNSTANYDAKVTEAKTAWLKNHLASVHFNEVTIVKYGTPKSEAVAIKNGILFDDEEKNRTEWVGTAYEPSEITATLAQLF